MNGILFMIRILAVLLTLSSCGNLPIAYIQNFSSINDVVFGFEDYEVTNEVFESFENSFIKVRFGRGPHSILILAFINDDVFEWVGRDNVRIFTKNGRVIKTLGLEHNFEITHARNELLPAAAESYQSLNLYNPDLYVITMLSSFDSSQETIKRLEDKIKTLRIEEAFSIPSIGWKKTNQYFQSLSSDQIYKTNQHVHPRLPLMKVEFYYKF